MSPSRALAIALFAALTAAACGDTGQPVSTGAAPTTPTSTPPSDEGGFGAPVADLELDAPGSVFAVTGVVGLSAAGCWHVTLNESTRLMAFPTGWDFGATSSIVRNAAGSEIADGELVDGSVRFVHESSLPVDGKWANYLEVCKPEIPEVAVFDVIGPAYDPDALTAAERREAIATADFTETWPCGRGWAASTADQRVGILIYQIDDAQPTPHDRLTLPDPGWQADVVVGKHLFANHCNDAIEEWMPTPQVVGSYPLAATITLHGPAPANDEPPALVRATLDEGTIDVDGSSVIITSVVLDNSAYNAFAG